MGVRHAITTVDNPFDPFNQFLAWLTWDHEHGYDTSDYLGRIVKYSDELSDADQAEAVSRAIDEIILEHGDGLYIKVTRDESEVDLV